MSSDISVFPQDNDFFSHLYEDHFNEGWEDASAQYEMGGYDQTYQGDFGSISINPAVIMVLLAVVVGIVLVGMAGSLEYSPSSQTKPLATTETAVSPVITQPKPAEVNISTDTLTFVAPYSEYSITQGVHGASYGHMAIDIAAGRGEPILAPINGEITQLYMDEYGNTTLVIENDVYQVTFLHGDFAVAIGDKLKVGQQIGTEGNNGYTMDMAGNLCYNREWCGNHTHLNVFDKRIQANINPLNLIGG
ncbi:MAG: M23 family metallopeptidase [Anaerolineae bacterium]|nr:M23 family metallopeptidase [Anaerolineae bacterium]